MRYGLMIAVFLALGGFAQAKERIPGPGKSRWLIKTSLPDGTNLSAPGKKVALKDLLVLEDPKPKVTRSDRRYATRRIPASPNALDAKEGDILETDGWVYLVALEEDGDYHIQVSARREDGNNCLIVEVPKDDELYVASPEVRNAAGEVRAFIREKLLNGGKGSGAGRVLRPPVYVHLKGQLFYDDAHVGDQSRGKKGMKAATLWELHPVVGIEVAAPPR